MITLKEAKNYLRVDFDEDDRLISDFYLCPARNNFFPDVQVVANAVSFYMIFKNGNSLIHVSYFHQTTLSLCSNKIALSSSVSFLKSAVLRFS